MLSCSRSKISKKKRKTFRKNTNKNSKGKSFSLLPIHPLLLFELLMYLKVEGEIFSHIYERQREPLGREKKFPKLWQGSAKKIESKHWQQIIARSEKKGEIQIMLNYTSLFFLKDVEYELFFAMTFCPRFNLNFWRFKQLKWLKCRQDFGL